MSVPTGAAPEGVVGHAVDDSLEALPHGVIQRCNAAVCQHHLCRQTRSDPSVGPLSILSAASSRKRVQTTDGAQGRHATLSPCPEPLPCAVGESSTKEGCHLVAASQYALRSPLDQQSVALCAVPRRRPAVSLGVAADDAHGLAVPVKLQGCQLGLPANTKKDFFQQHT